MSALLAAQSQSSTGSTASPPASRASALQDMFSQIDADGDGKITKSEFDKALGAGGTNLAQADDVFSKLDKNGDGSVSLGEMASALKGSKGRPSSPSSCGERLKRRLRRRRIEFRSVDAGPAGCFQHLRHQQRRFGDDVADLCGWIEGHDDLGRVRQFVERSDVVLQRHREDDPASGQGDLLGHRFAAQLERLELLDPTRLRESCETVRIERASRDPATTFGSRDLAEAIPPRR